MSKWGSYVMALFMAANAVCIPLNLSSGAYKSACFNAFVTGWLLAFMFAHTSESAQ